MNYPTIINKLFISTTANYRKIFKNRQERLKDVIFCLKILRRQKKIDHHNTVDDYFEGLRTN